MRKHRLPRAASPHIDDYFAGMAWQVCFNHITTEWLSASDPAHVSE